MRLMTDPAVEYMEVGEGRPTVLLHCSASGAHQWQALASDLQPNRRIVAPNLLGYGRTQIAIGEQRRSIGAHADAVLAVVGEQDQRVDFVGHSFGALVALEAATRLGDGAGRLVLFEPIQLALLRREGYELELAEVEDLQAYVRAQATRGAWLDVAARFTDYFSGDGVWSSMTLDRRSAMADALLYNPDEWEAAFSSALAVNRWHELKASVLLVTAQDTRAPFRAISEILLSECPTWQHRDLARGGHMAPITRPRQFNSEVIRFLDG